MTSVTAMNPSITSQQLRSVKYVILALAVMAVANAGCSKRADTKDEMLSRAKDAVAAGHYAEAEKEYSQVLRVASNDPVATRQLGIIYQDQGQLPQANVMLKKAAELSPDDLEVQLKLGLTLLSLRQFKEAREAALRVLDKQPDNEQALVLLADTALRLNDVDEMRKYIENLRDKHQEQIGYHLAFGVLDLGQNNQTDAESEFKAALALNPKSIGALTAVANFYWSRKDLKAAEQALKTAADLSPPRSPARLRYADFKLRTGAVAEAEKILEDITRSSPDYLPAQVYLMKIACDQHRAKDCAADIASILAADPTNFDALFADGTLNLANRDAAKAVREFEFLSSNYTQNAEVRYHLALAYLLVAKSANAAGIQTAESSAESNLAEAIRLDPHFAQAILLLAQLRIKAGSAVAATDLLTPLIKDQPNVAEAQYLLALAYLAQRQPNKALAVYRRMTELFPKDPQPAFLIGRMLLAGRQPPEAARKEFEKSISISPDYLPAIETMVDLDIADKRYAAAMDRVQGLIDKDPKQAPAWAVRGKIYLAQRDFTHAEADLLKAIELDPKLEVAYVLLSQLYIASNRQDQAIAKLNAFVEKYKDDQARTLPALLQLAMLQQSLKNFSGARDAYEKLLAASPNLPLALNNLAILYADNLGQLDRAYDLAKKAREAVPNDPHIADTLGWIFLRRENTVTPCRYCWKVQTLCLASPMFNSTWQWRITC